MAFEKLVSHIDEIDENKLVQVFETNEKIKYKDAFYCRYIGKYFKKDDPRIIKDIITNEDMLFDINYQNKYYNYHEYYFGISEDSQFNDLKYSLVDIHFCADKIIVIDDIRVDINLLNNETFKKHYKEYYGDGKFYKINNKIFNQPFEKQLKTKGYKYDVDFNNFLDIYMQNKPFTFNKTLGKKYTWGVEIETISGILPRHLTKNIYYSSVHDGSLRHKDDNEVYGYEYVTNVLKGDLGLKQLKMLNNEITKRCLINYQCGELIATLISNN